MNFNIKFLNGFGGLLGKIALMLTKFLPIYIVVFIAYGDRFLPSPLSDFSTNTRNAINGALLGSSGDSNLKNDKYNNKKSDKIIEEVEKKNKDR
jgi:hypothetical protein